MLATPRTWLLAVSSVALLGVLAFAAVARGQPMRQSERPVSVEMSVGVADNALVYSLTLRNTGSSDIGQIFIAGSVPAGALTLDAVNTPVGAWFKGFEAPGTPLSSAVWLAERIPANGTLGPFIYRVEKGEAFDLSAYAWVHWRLPLDGTVRSADVNPVSTPVLGMALGQRFHNIHAVRLGLQCSLCHVPRVEEYQDPLAQVFNLADRGACLTCHGGIRVLYGEDWKKSSVSR